MTLNENIIMSVINIEKLQSKELFPGFVARMEHLEHMTFSHWTIAKGSTLPMHNHVHEQISILIKGKFEFTLDNEKYVITPGMVVLIPSEARHSGVALEDCQIMDIFHPVRKDYQEQMK